MKKLTFYFIVLTIVSSCNTNLQKNKDLKTINSGKNEDFLELELRTFLKNETNLSHFDSYVTVIYKSPIHNFDVKVLWLPFQLATLNHISGPAIIEFTNSDKATHFTIKADDFALPLKIFDIEFEEIHQIYKSTIKLDYTDPEIDNEYSFWVNQPFFFYDVNFDGKEELILTLFGYGVKNSNAYKAFSLKNFQLESESNQITNKKPFALLNDFTAFDKENEIIKIGEMLGGGGTQNTFYKKIADNEFRAISIIKYTFDTKTTYKLFNNEMQEVSKEKIKL